MTERKWTPGPWFVDKDFDVVTDRCSVMLGSVAIRSDETSKANAYLTAAAPDLYEALEWLSDHADDSEASRDDNWHERLEKARAALSKARGEVK